MLVPCGSSCLGEQLELELGCITHVGHVIHVNALASCIHGSSEDERGSDFVNIVVIVAGR